MKEVIALTKFAKESMEKNDYKTAKVALIKAIKSSPTSAPLYTSLGDTYYLLKDKDNAVKCYLAAIHLQISAFTKMQTATFSTLLSIKFEEAPEEIREILPCKEGMIIYEDSNVPSRIAHAFIDIDPIEPVDPIVRECSKIFSKHLTTGKTIKEVTKTSNICFEDYLSFNESHYIILGRELIIDSIKWDDITSKNVRKLYFQSN